MSKLLTAAVHSSHVNDSNVNTSSIISRLICRQLFRRLFSAADYYITAAGAQRQVLAESDVVSDVRVR